MQSNKVSPSIESDYLPFFNSFIFRFWRITESGPKRNTAANQVREGDKRSSPQTEKNSAGVIKSVTATTNLLESKV